MLYHILALLAISILTTGCLAGVAVLHSQKDFTESTKIRFERDELF